MPATTRTSQDKRPGPAGGGPGVFASNGTRQDTTTTGAVVSCGLPHRMTRKEDEMPLMTQILRDGEPLQLRWGDFHIAAIALAACFDAGHGAISEPGKVYEGTDPRMFDCYPDAPFPVTRQITFILAEYGALANTPLNYGAYTLKSRHAFIDGADGEVLRLLPGDVLRAVRG